jgi:hypothetical protein
VEVHPVFIEDLAAFALAMVMVLVAVLALGWAEDVAARRRARLSPVPAKPFPRPFEASTDTAEPNPRQPTRV